MNGHCPDLASSVAWLHAARREVNCGALMSEGILTYPSFSRRSRRLRAATEALRVGEG